MTKQKLAILFWFYKNPLICLNRLKSIKKYNPNAKIYGLYGGEQKYAKIFKKMLYKYLDDFYISPYKESKWKWLNGDLMILDWYNNHKYKKDWEHIIIIQWDALVFTNLSEYFKDIKRNEIFLSGIRLLSKWIERKYHWTNPNRNKRPIYLKFLEYIKKHYKYKGKTIFCPFLIAIFNHKFFQKYNKVKEKELGFLEYKIPLYAKIFKIPLYKKDIGVYHFDKDINNTPLNSMPVEIKRTYILKELKKPKGWRIFHPYFKIWH